jgi:hypothetical protein
VTTIVNVTGTASSSLSFTIDYIRERDVAASDIQGVTTTASIAIKKWEPIAVSAETWTGLTDTSETWTPISETTEIWIEVA